MKKVWLYFLGITLCVTSCVWSQTPTNGYPFHPFIPVVKTTQELATLFGIDSDRVFSEQAFEDLTANTHFRTEFKQTFAARTKAEGTKIICIYAASNDYHMVAAVYSKSQKYKGYDLATIYQMDITSEGTITFEEAKKKNPDYKTTLQLGFANIKSLGNFYVPTQPRN
ncbi:MAG: hypothetical protein R3A11_05915 [Bdellovibrionota bacterium]